MQLDSDPERRLKCMPFISIYTHLSDREREQCQSEYPQGAKTMQSFPTRMRQDGIQLGEANVLVYPLEQELGAVGEETRERVKQADPETLLRGSGRVLA